MVGDYLNDVGSTTTSAASGNIFSAGASVLNNVVNNLFQSGVRNEQKNAIIVQEKLAQLTNAQQEQLNQQLAETTDANQQLQIVLNAVGQSGSTIATASTSSYTYLAIALLGGALLVLSLVIILSKTPHE